MDLIDREQAIEWLNNWGNINKHYHPHSKNKTIPMSEVIDILERVPTAEKTGKWMLNDNGTFSCSLCQSWMPNEQHHYARYCLYCGARMED